MNNYFTMHHQVSFINDTLKGFRFDGALSRFKKTLEIQFSSSDSKKDVLFYAGSNAAIFIQDTHSIKRNNLASFFEELEGLSLLEATLSKQDRVITFSFEANFRLVFYAFGPKANVFLVKNDEIIDQFRNDEIPTANKELKQGDFEEITKLTTIKDKILCRESRFPRHLISSLESIFLPQLSDDAALMMMVDHWVYIFFNKPTFRRLSNGSVCLLDNSIIMDNEARIFENSNELIRDVWIQRERRDRFSERMNRIRDQIHSTMKRYEKILSYLEDEQTSLARIEKYETTGHILMAYSYMGIVSSDEITLDNIFIPDTHVTLAVKKGLSFSDNAQLYYDKAKGTRKTLIANKDRMQDIRKKMYQLDTLAESFKLVDGSKSLDRWTKEHHIAFNALVQDQSNKEAISRPWRSFQYMGFEVWIGKTAAGNDELLQVSHKEDIWLHARHVSGSHTIIRMNKKLGFPNLEIIEHVASWAAWYSKAKTAGLAPVIYTKRKFVRKPKGAAPGSVLVDKEQVILVHPQKPEQFSED
jgi:predicted ribosome quality control (RQC) complex YloA/Tae2 family protein